MVVVIALITHNIVDYKSLDRDRRERDILLADTMPISERKGCEAWEGSLDQEEVRV